VYNEKMEKPSIIMTGIIALGLAGAVGFSIWERAQPEEVGCTMEAKICPDGSAVGRSGPKCEFAPCPDAVAPENGNDPGEERTVPLDRAADRVTKKPFGIYIDPKTSPVQPERFRGYHTGTDFETFPAEASADVAVAAICGGEVIAKRSASGYGGVLVTRCMLDGQAVTVVYGHLALASVATEVGESVKEGERLGLLGGAGSRDTDGERKHLHLGIHKGSAVNILGYAADREALSAWLDPCLFVCE
jgi:murein DD-endopeptidase MepM/ murein hydrolase activator NlpD